MVMIIGFECVTMNSVACGKIRELSIPIMLFTQDDVNIHEKIIIVLSVRRAVKFPVQ
jgi:hypothetical protein